MRLETGVVQVDGDWPGIFIRGDQALAYAMYLETAFLSGLSVSGVDKRDIDARYTPQVRSLVRLLKRCDAAQFPEAQLIQLAPVVAG